MQTHTQTHLFWILTKLTLCAARSLVLAAVGHSTFKLQLAGGIVAATAAGRVWMEKAAGQSSEGAIWLSFDL